MTKYVFKVYYDVSFEYKFHYSLVFFFPEILFLNSRWINTICFSNVTLSPYKSRFSQKKKLVNLKCSSLWSYFIEPPFCWIYIYIYMCSSAINQMFSNAPKDGYEKVNHSTNDCYKQHDSKANTWSLKRSRRMIDESFKPYRFDGAKIIKHWTRPPHQVLGIHVATPPDDSHVIR